MIERILQLANLIMLNDNDRLMDIFNREVRNLDMVSKDDLRQDQFHVIINDILRSERAGLSQTRVVAHAHVSHRVGPMPKRSHFEIHAEASCLRGNV